MLNFWTKHETLFFDNKISCFQAYHNMEAKHFLCRPFISFVKCPKTFSFLTTLPELSGHNYIVTREGKINLGSCLWIWIDTIYVYLVLITYSKYNFTFETFVGCRNIWTNVKLLRIQKKQNHVRIFMYSLILCFMCKNYQRVFVRMF